MTAELMISIGSVIVAVVAAIAAVRSSRASRSSAKIAEVQAQLSYQSLVGEAEPSAMLELDEVEYRWSSSGIVLTPGGATDAVVTREALVTLNEASSMGLHAEIVLRGRLVNQRSSQMLVTYKGSWADEVRYPLQNQSLFLIDGEEQQHMTVAANGSLDFVWVDRRSIDQWRQLYIAAEQPRAKDEELQIPRGSFWERVADEVQSLRDPRYDRSSLWRAKIRENNGFRLVVERRAAERIATVWTVTPHQAPVDRREWEHGEKKWRWGLREAVNAPIDDEVIFYRYTRDATLAQVDPPRERWVPGRF